MATLAEKFIKRPEFKQLGFRAQTTYEMLKHLGKFHGGLIVETGTAWCRDNWNGQGQSTLIWDWVCEQEPLYRAQSFDISPGHIEIARSQTKHVQFKLGDSVTSLNNLTGFSDLRLLYLDSFDWSAELQFESSFHHLTELATIWAKIPSGCMICVDDRHSTHQGKHFLVQRFMEKLGYQPVFCDYQVGWIKA